MEIAFTGDGLRLTSSNEQMFVGGLKHVDRRLPNQPSQSKTEYFPLVVCFASEKQSIRYIKAVDAELLRIEKERTLHPTAMAVLPWREDGDVIATHYNFYIKVVKPADMKYTWAETERGGGAGTSPAPICL